jgi:CDP-diacylglycerol--serine O-phosphatidyltransferase
MFWTPDLTRSEWPQTLRLWMVAALILTGLLMVSTFRYASFKKVDPKARLSYRFLVVIGVLLLVLAYYPDAIFVAIAILYTTSGPLGWLFGRLRRKGPDAPVVSEIAPNA